MNNLTTGNKTRRTVPLAVVDYHHHVLPFLHEGIRKRRVPFSRNTLLHFDAHPDLMAPKELNAADVFKPQKLYEALDNSESGIAEFILPTVYAGHIDRVVWVKPQWSQQVPIPKCRIIIYYHA